MSYLLMIAAYHQHITTSAHHLINQVPIFKNLSTMTANSYPKFSLSKNLTKAQINFFDEHGFIHFKQFIQPETVQLLINASLEVQKEWIKKQVTKVNGVPIKYGKDLQGEPIVQRFAFINQHHAVFAELLRD